MHSFRANGYEILQHSLCEGWINNLYAGNDIPYVFSTIEAAIAELQEEFDDWEFEIETGERDKDEGYDICSFQIRCNTTGVRYNLDLIDGKVIISDGISCN